MAEITMPRLSDTMSEGTVGKWLKQPGDQIESGEIIAEIETDKATMELEAFESGTLTKILVPEGQLVPIGTPIGLIGGDAVEAAPAAPVAAPTAAPPAPVARPRDGDETNDRIKASPMARRMAEEHGIDLGQVQGTGPGGRIIKENIEDFQQKQSRSPAAPPAPTPAPALAKAPTSTPAPAGPSTHSTSSGQVGSGQAEVMPFSRMRRAIARAMNEAKPGVPHIYVTAEIEMGAAMQLRRSLNDSGASEVKISINDLVVKAAAKALAKFQAINSSFATGADGQPGVVQHRQINVSVAVALEDGLIAPVIKDADKKSLGAIAAEVKDMAGRARAGKIKQNELEGATFQVSNLGMYDVLAFGSIISAPQAASLAVGGVRQAPVVRDGQIVVGQVMHATISADHRVVDGATAAQYLQELRRLLESPMSLLV